MCVANVCRAELHRERHKEAKNPPEETFRRENDITKEEEEASSQTDSEPICGHAYVTCRPDKSHTRAANTPKFTVSYHKIPHMSHIFKYGFTEGPAGPSEPRRRRKCHNYVHYFTNSAPDPVLVSVRGLIIGSGCWVRTRWGRNPVSRGVMAD